MPHKRCLVLVLGLALAACGEKKAELKNEEAHSDLARAGSGGPVVEILFDGTLVASLGAVDLTMPVALGAVVDEEQRDWRTWLQVEAVAADGRTLVIPEPAIRYAAYTPRVYFGEHGPSLGWYLGENSQPRLRLVGATEIRIHTKLPEPAGFGFVLTLAVKGQPEIEVGAAALAALKIRSGSGKGGKKATQSKGLEPLGHRSPGRQFC